MSTYIQNEVIAGDGTETTFELANAYKEGTVKVLVDGKLTYDFYEVSAGAEAPQEIEFLRAPSSSREILVSYYPADEQNTINVIRYATPAQAKIMSRVSGFVGLEDAVMDKFIREAELLIDQYIAYPYTGYHGNAGQRLKFPRRKDEEKFYNTDQNTSDYVGIPQDITTATIWAAENLFLVGDVKAEDGSGVISSEKIGDYSYTKTGAVSNAASFGAAQLIGSRARSLAQKYRKAYRGMKIGSESGNEALLNSRQRFARDNY